MNKTMERFRELMGKENIAGSQMEELIMLPDDIFDSIYLEFKKQLLASINTTEAQEEIRKVTSNSSIEDIEKEKAEILNFIEEIKKEDGLSANKKDVLISLLNESIVSALDFVGNPRVRIPVKISLDNSNAKIPEYAHSSDAGADIFSSEEITIHPNETKAVGTGIKLEIPKGYEIQIRPRSGLSLKTGLRIANSIGTIDADYRGEVKVLLWNSGSEDYTIKIGDKIAQMLIKEVPMIKFELIDSLSKTERGEKGFGSTG